MTNKDILVLNKVLKGNINLPGVKWKYFCSINRRMIAPIADSLDKTIEFSYDYRQYDKAREELCIKYCKRDEKDKPVIVNDVYQFNEDNRHKFDSAVMALNEEPEHKAAIEARKKQEEEYANLLDCEAANVPVLHVIKLEDIPAELSGDTMYFLTGLDIVKEA